MTGGIGRPVAVHEHHQTERSGAALRQRQDTVEGLLRAGNRDAVFSDGEVILIDHP